MSLPFPPSAEFEAFNAVGSCLGIIVGMYNLGHTTNATPYVQEAEVIIEELVKNPKLPVPVKDNLKNCSSKLKNFVKAPSAPLWEGTMVNFQCAFDAMFPQPHQQ